MEAPLHYWPSCLTQRSVISKITGMVQTFLRVETLFFLAGNSKANINNIVVVLRCKYQYRRASTRKNNAKILH